MAVKFTKKLVIGVCSLCKRTISSPRQILYFNVRHKSDFPKSTTDPFCSAINETIDVRSPQEFKEDHIPGAINLPVLDNEQRSEVGTIYTKNSFEARKTGAKIVTQNICKYLDTYFNDKPVDYSPLIYCWRGGQRSRSLGIILAEIGFPVYVLTGGYKTYRKQVLSDLENLPAKFEFRVISGLTGSGKTYILNKLEEYGHQVIDLEGLAKHKGSVLGLWYNEEQPSQKYYETLIREKLSKLDTTRPIWVESESIRIGSLFIGKHLFNEMCKAKKFCIHLPISERVKFTLTHYNYWTKDFDLLEKSLFRLKKVHGNKKIEEWLKLAEMELWEEFVERLLKEHYDIQYKNSQSKNNLSGSIEDIEMPDLSDNSINDAIARLTMAVPTANNMLV